MRFLIGFAIAGSTQASMFDWNKQFDAQFKPNIRKQPGFADFKHCLDEKRNKIKTHPTKETVFDMENECGPKLRILSDEFNFNTVDFIRNILAFEKEINDYMRQFGDIDVLDDGYIEYLHDGSRVGVELAQCLTAHEKVLMESIAGDSDRSFGYSWKELEKECRRFIMDDLEYANTLVAYNAHVTGLVSFKETMGPLLELVNLELMRVLVASRTAMKQAIDEEDIDKLNRLFQIFRNIAIAYTDGIVKQNDHVQGIQLLRETAVATINQVFPDLSQPEGENTAEFWAKMEKDYAYPEEGLDQFEESPPEFARPFLKLVELEFERVFVASRTAMEQAIDEKDLDKLNKLLQICRKIAIAYTDGIVKQNDHVPGIELVKDISAAKINEGFPDLTQLEGENTAKFWAEMKEAYALTEENLEEMRKTRLDSMVQFAEHPEIARKLDDIAIELLVSTFDNPLD